MLVYVLRESRQARQVVFIVPERGQRRFPWQLGELYVESATVSQRQQILPIPVRGEGVPQLLEEHVVAGLVLGV